MREILIYVHGKGGSAEEVDHYKPLFPNCEVIGFDYRSQTPWEAKEEFPVFFAQQRQRCDRLTLIAGSIGAFFSMSALDKTLVDRAYFVSPVVDMENLIGNMMQWSNVTEQALAEKREIATDFGETLSWEYLCYVRKHPTKTKTKEQWNAVEITFTEEGKTIMMENVLSFMRAAAPWISMGLLIAFLCVRPAIRKGKAEDDYAEEGMCVGMCLGLMLGSLSDSSNSGLGASLGMLFGLVIGLCMHKKGTEDRGNEK